MKYKLKLGLYFYYESDQICYITDINDVLQKTKYEDIEETQYHWVNKDYYKGYETNDLETLIRFKTDYNNWVNEISKVIFYTEEDKKYRINPKYHKNLKSAVRKIVFNFSKITEKECKAQIENIDRDEYLISKECYNAGLMTYDNTQINKAMEIYGYDFSSKYPNRLNFISIPKTRGKKTIINELNFDKLLCGIYRVEIKYTNPKFRVLFSFSEKSHYHSSTLRNIYNHKDLFGLTFTLLKPDEDYSYNAYIYEGSEYLKGEDIFKDWLKSMMKIKAQCSKENQLIKYLISSSWGVLTETKKIQIADDEMENYDTDEAYIYKEANEKGRLLLDSNDIAYSKGLYRIKLILTASVRNFMLNYAIKNEIIDKIIRIHTDSYMLNSPHNFNTAKNKCKITNEIIMPKCESKSTGYIKVYNCQIYRHVCKTCNIELKYEDYINHKC